MRINNLIAAVIQSGIKELDIEYFNSVTFEEHCDILDFDVEVLRKKIFQNFYHDKKIRKQLHDEGIDISPDWWYDEKKYTNFR